MIKRYQLVLVDGGYLGKKVQAKPSPTGEMVMYDDVEAAISQARAEEQERILWAVYNRWGEGARDDVIEAIREADAIRSMGDE